MALLSIFSRRKRQAEQPAKDVYEYENVPIKVRVQILMNISKCISAVGHYNFSSEQIYESITSELREEVGRFSLTNDYHSSIAEEIGHWFLNHATTDELFDAIELFVMVTSRAADNQAHTSAIRQSIARINARLLEAGLGYEIAGQQVIEKSNEYAHTEVVLPALHVLSERRFSNANKEFREAHHAYRAGEYEDCLVDCLKAFESVMKVIADERGWQIPKTANASKLIAALFEHEFVPKYMQNQFAGLKAMLESSVPTTRNKDGGHGAGAEERKVPQSLAALQLHQTAAIIIFLAAIEG